MPDSTRVDRLIGWRHDLHQRPATAFAEDEAAAYVADVLQGLGFEVATGIGGTGVVGSLTLGRGGRVIGLRADLDGLPLDEVPGRAYGSRNPGTMHACGHDGHMAMVLGAAAELARLPTTQDGPHGVVRAVFQPAEEPGRGAQAMIDDGLLSRFPMDAIVGLHNIPGIPAGHLHARTGAIMAGEDNFTIEIEGRGGHASAPHLVTDPIVIGAEIVTALQTVIARSVDPMQSAVLSCTDFRTDGARNAIPGKVTITGDTRCFDTAVSELIERRIREVATGIAAAHGARAGITYTREFAPTVNDPGLVELATAAAREALGDDRVTGEAPAITASEDFGVFGRHIPACFAFVGNGTEPGRGGTPLHSRDYDFNDDILTTGVDYYVAVVAAFLRS